MEKMSSILYVFMNTDIKLCSIVVKIYIVKSLRRF